MLSKEVIHVYGLIRSRLFYFSTSALESLLSKGMLGTPVIEVNLYTAQSQNRELCYIS